MQKDMDTYEKGLQEVNISHNHRVLTMQSHPRSKPCCNENLYKVYSSVMHLQIAHIATR